MLHADRERLCNDFSGAPMLYLAYEAQATVLDLARPFAATAGAMLRLPRIDAHPLWPLYKLAGNLEAFAELGVTYARRPFGIDEVTVGNSRIPVTEEVTYQTPFCTLLRFKKV